MSKLRIVPLLLFAALACGHAAAPRPGTEVPPASPSADAWVESTLQRLTLREKVGQMVVPWIGGDYLAVDSDAHERLRDWVVRQGIGGVIISIGPPLEVAGKLNRLQRLADVPLLVSVDMEHGPGQRLDGGTVLPYGLEIGGGTEFPPVMAIGAADDERLAYELGRITALEARAVGVHMTYAPVVDVNNNPANPVINTRSYGEDPHRVARLAVAHLRGLQENGLLATAKHFPGHGDTGTDSHLALPVTGIDRARADSVELVPFRAAIDAGVAAVMSAHMAFPALTGDSTPATLSKRVLTGLLQEDLGFDGLVLTDALNMGGIVRGYGQAEAAVRSIRAGADVLLMPLDIGATIDAVVAAVEAGELAESRIDRSVRKLLRAKAGMGLHRERTVELERVAEHVGSRAHAAVAEEAAARSITLVRDRDRLVPARPATAERVLSIVYADDPDPFAGRVFQRELARRFAAVRTARIDGETHASRLDALLAAADSADLVLFSPFVRALAYKGDVAIAEPVAAMVRSLAARRPTIVTSFGNPYVLSQFPEVGTYMLAWGPEPVAQRAAARALTGEAAIGGRLPISLPPYHRVGEGIRMDHTLRHATPAEVGMDSARLARVDALLRDAVAGGAVPGAALAIGRRGGLVRLQGYGRLDPRPGFGPVTDSTLYDLASLTKVVGTTTATMMMVDDGKLELDAPVSRYLPEWRGSAAKARVTIRHLLTHTSGLPAYGPLWKELRGRDAYLRRIASMGLEFEPGTRTVYSDFGMILLALLVERVAGEPIDALLERRLFGPLGMRDTGYNPVEAGAGEPAEGPLEMEAKASPLLDRIAPTEVDTVFRGAHLHGVVHDENAYAIGGVSGHAGLFSSARDLAVFAQMLLNGGHYGDAEVVRPGTVRRFTRRQSEASSRALGWDTPSGRSSAGDYFPADAFGHTGFTGTSLWIDPQQELFVVLLTNRVNPTRANQKHVRLRREIHDAVQRAITDRPATKRVDVAEQ